MSPTQRRTEVSRIVQRARLFFVFVFAILAAGAHAGCRRTHGRASAHDAWPRRATEPSVDGMYWGRVGDVPDGMRAQVWLEALSDGRIRGGYEAVPWSGDLEGARAADGTLALTLRERGFNAAIGARDRAVTMRWEVPAVLLVGYDERRVRIELHRANRGDPSLRPGLWIARWTGLPHGLGVDVRLARDADGHYRATYQYQGTGGVRDGTLDGTVDPTGALSLRWTELVEGGALARGRARLLPWRFGMRGTYGIDDTEAGTGEWTLEYLAD